MSGFGVLYYTDCRPGQGLLGGAGFQFQAGSAELPPEAAQLVQRGGLYEPPTAWMRSKRPVTEYPASLTHTSSGDLYVTSAGCYLGLEANGTREGNQFTHAVVTTEPASYGMARPAQLWGAPWWVREPAPTTRLDRMGPVPRTGPCSADVVRDRLADLPDAQEWLIALLSAVHRLDGPDRRTILVISPDAEEVACWIAAATLLVPLVRALRVSFKIFATDLQRSGHDIVALHPDWAGPWSSTAGSSGFAVFDLPARRYTDVPATDSARFWVPRFLRHDPFDVVDAVEHAGRFAGSRAGAGADDEVDRLAGAVAALDEPVTSLAQARALADWLAGMPQEVVGPAADRVVDAVLAAAPTDGETLLHLRSVIVHRGPQSLLDRTSVGLLDAEIAAALADPGAAGARPVTAPEPLADGRLSEAGTRTMLERIERALAGARPSRVADLLDLAARHRLRPRPGCFAATTSGFAEWWLDHPDEVEFRPGWTVGADVKDWLRAALAGRLAGRLGGEVEEQIDRHWLELLMPTVMFPGDLLDKCLCGLAYRRAAGDERRALVREVLRRCAAVEGTDVGSVGWNAVFAYPAETDLLVEAEDFLGVLVERNHRVSQPLATAVFQMLEDAGSPSEVGLRIIGLVEEQGFAAPPSLAGWSAQDRAATRATHELRRASGWDKGAALAGQLAFVTPDVLALHAVAMSRALLDADPEAALGLLARCTRELRERLLRSVQARWPVLGQAPAGTYPARAVALSFLFLQEAAGDPSVDASAIRTPLEVLARGLGRKARSTVNRAYDHELDPAWTEWLKANDRPDAVSTRGGTGGIVARLRARRRSG